MVAPNGFGILNLILNNIEEGQTLEFKKALPEPSDKGKAEFLKDVTALANADGGQIVFGINEKAGKAYSLEPLALEDRDHEQRRLLQILESQIEPRITGLKLEWVEIEARSYCVVSVPRSYAAPHRCFHNGQTRF